MSARDSPRSLSPHTALNGGALPPPPPTDVPPPVNDGAGGSGVDSTADAQQPLLSPSEDQQLRGVYGTEAEAEAAALKADANALRCCGTRLYVVVVIALTALNCILLGYDIGVFSGAKLFVQAEFDLSDSEVELVVGILNFVSSVGGLFSGKLSDVIGRKKTIFLACLVFLAGSLLMCFAMNFSTLMVGRVLTGVGVGCGLAIAPLYMAELSPKKIRGALVTINEVSINIGILLGFVAGYAFSTLSDDINWRVMLGMGAVPPMLILVSLFFMPESPRYLVRHNKPQQALKVLLKTCDSAEAMSTLEVLQEECRTTQYGSFKDLLFPDKRLRPLLIAGLGVAFFQQASGIEALVYYVPEVLAQAGITDEQTQLAANMGVGIVKLLFIFVAMFLSDRLGRRHLLSISAVTMTVAFVMVGISFSVGKQGIAGLTITGICVFMAGFSIGFGPVTWIMQAEIYPLRVRGMAAGAGTFINRIMSGTIAMTYLSLSKQITEVGCFYMFAAIALISLFFVLYCVPETKGKTLEEIEESAQNARLGPRCCCCANAQVGDAKYAPIENGNGSGNGHAQNGLTTSSSV